jgi:hypothetical protein
MANQVKKSSRSKFLTHRQKLWIQVKTKIVKPKYTFNPNSSDNMDFDSIDIKVKPVIAPEKIEVVDWISAYKFDWSGYRYNDDDLSQDNEDDLSQDNEEGDETMLSVNENKHFFNGNNIFDDNEEINSDYDKMWN